MVGSSSEIEQKTENWNFLFLLQYSLKISIKMRLDVKQRQFVIEKHFEKLSTKEIQTKFRKKMDEKSLSTQKPNYEDCEEMEIKGINFGQKIRKEDSFR